MPPPRDERSESLSDGDADNYQLLDEYSAWRDSGYSDRRALRALLHEGLRLAELKARLIDAVEVHSARERRDPAVPKWRAWRVMWLGSAPGELDQDEEALVPRDLGRQSNSSRSSRSRSSRNQESRREVHRERDRSKAAIGMVDRHKALPLRQALVRIGLELAPIADADPRLARALASVGWEAGAFDGNPPLSEVSRATSRSLVPDELDEEEPVPTLAGTRMEPTLGSSGVARPEPAAAPPALHAVLMRPSGVVAAAPVLGPASL